MKKIEIKSTHVNFIGAWNIENNNLISYIVWFSIALSSHESAFF